MHDPECHNVSNNVRADSYVKIHFSSIYLLFFNVKILSVAAWFAQTQQKHSYFLSFSILQNVAPGEPQFYLFFLSAKEVSVFSLLFLITAHFVILILPSFNTAQNVNHVLLFFESARSHFLAQVLLLKLKLYRVTGILKANPNVVKL